MQSSVLSARKHRTPLRTLLPRFTRELNPREQINEETDKVIKNVILFLAFCLTTFGQDAPLAVTAPAGAGGNLSGLKPVTGPTPRLPDGRPDFSGIWIGGGPVGDLAVGLAKGETIPLLPAAEKLMNSRQSKEA